MEMPASQGVEAGTSPGENVFLKIRMHPLKRVVPVFGNIHRLDCEGDMVLPLSPSSTHG